jgi:hypothetical protein
MNTSPFISGRAVTTVEFHDQRRVLRRLLGRLTKGESTAIVGQPHSGKTSLLHFIQDADARQTISSEPFDRCLFRYIDSHMLGSQFTQAEFWDHVLGPLAIYDTDETIRDLYTISEENEFGAFTLERLFAALARADWRVILFLDEFEAILTHPVLNSAEFYGSLRSLASRFSSLALVIATRRSLNYLNMQTDALNPHGSPYFNIFTELRLEPLPIKDANTLLKQADAHFSPEDRQFVLDVSGRHPYLLQLAASLLWDAHHDGQQGEQRHDTVAHELYDQTQSHFADTWRAWSNAERKAVTAIALAQIPTLVEGHDFKAQALVADIFDYSAELRGLAQAGTVAETEDGGWQIMQEVLLWWLADEIKRTTRDDTDFTDWLQDQEYGAAFTREERQRFFNAARAVSAVIINGASPLIEAFAKGYSEGQGKLASGAD